MKARSGPQIQTNDESRKDDDPSVDVLRRQREQVFREVGFSTLAEQAVNGYTTIQYPAMDEIASHPTAHSSSDHFLTPPIDISNLGNDSNDSGNSGGDIFKQHPTTKHPTTLLPPEAGLHRDGEQARLVEGVRRRQLQQRKHHQQTTFEWLEEILFNGGFIEDSRTTRSSHRDTHLTVPLNPYRDPGQALKHPASNHDPIRISQSIRNDQLPSQRSPPAIIPSKYPFLHHVLTKLLRAFRWFIDCSITRLAGLEPLKSSDTVPIYSTAPAYSFHITADDIIHFLVVLWITVYSNIQMQVHAVPMILMMSVLLGSAGCKVVRRIHSGQNQGPIPQQHGAKIDAVTTKIALLQVPIPSSTMDGTISRLQKLHPNATIAECKRFFACVKCNEEAASKRIEEFFRWRSECGLKAIVEACGERSDDRHVREFDQAFVEKDEKDWNASAKLAISIVTKSHVSDKLPQIICSYEERFEERSDSEVLPKQNVELSSPPRCKDGTRILHILPFRLDLSIATAPTYSLAAALYLDRRLSRMTMEKITLLCDVRGGRGWANPTPWSTLPFIQSTASLLGSHYPERLERLVLFPMPMSATWVWSAAKKCLDPNTSSKVVVVSPGQGSAPPEQLLEFVDKENLNVLEKRRQSFFLG